MAEDEKPTTDTRDMEKFMATARKRFEQDMADEKPLRDEAEKDLKFVAGDQWESGIKSKREAAGRPALTFNRCHTFVQQVSNEARQNKTAIKYTPAEESDQDTAEVYEGLARHIHYSSKAQIARETAIEYSAGGSFGYYRYLTKYCNNENNDQELEVVPVFDPFSVYGVLIPAILGQERKHAFIVSEMTKDEYLAEYPDSELGKDWNSGLKYSPWVDTETVKVAEYWYCEDVKNEEKSKKLGRPIYDCKVSFCKINGVEVLPDSETEWVGSTIPIYPVLGKAMFVNGKPKLFSVVRFQRDPQMLINYGKSRIAETLGTAPIQPYLVPRGAITPELQKQWESLNIVQRPYLEYETVQDSSGKPLPAPTRQVFEPPIQALSEMVAQEIDDMKATTGIYDASLGAKSNEQTGVAIARRQQQSDVTNMHFLDNLTRADQEAGNDMAEIIPKIYDTPRMIRILGADEAPKIVKVNEQFQDGNETKEYRIGGEGVGKYDVIVTTERSFSSKRMESFDMYAQLGQSNPEMAFATSDLMLRNSDMAGADEAAERMKQIIFSKFPFLQQNEDNKEQPIPPQAQMAIQDLQQKLQVAMHTGQQMSQELDQYKAGAQVKQMEVQSKERIRQMELQHERELEMARLGVEQQKLQTGVATKSAELDSRETIAAFQGEVQMAQHGMSLDAQAAANEAKQAAQAMESE